MGNYATTAQLKARFEDDAAVAALTDTAESGTPDSDVLDEVLNNAEAEVDSYLAKRYSVPVAVASDTVLAARLKSLTLDIAEWNLLSRGDAVTEVKAGRYEAAIDWLTKIAEGKIVLPAAATPDSTESDTPGASWGIPGAAVSGTSQRVFTRESQENL